MTAEALEAPSQQGSRRRRSATAILLALAVVIGVAAPLLASALSGNLSIPHNDAWAYSRIAWTFARTGHIQLLGWGRQSLFGQFLVIGPFARWIVAQQVYVAVLGSVAMAATYDLLRPFTGPRRAALGALIVAVWPGYALLTTSFMADLPAFTAMLLCLAVGRRALASHGAWLLALSTLLGLWGCTIREQALAAPVAVLAVAGWSAYRRRAGRLAVVGLAAALGALFGTFELWRRSYPGEDPGLVGHQKGSAVVVQGALQGYFLVALVLTPAVLLVSRPWRWGPRAWLATTLGAVLARYSVHKYHAYTFFSGNYLTRSGPYPQAGNGSPQPMFSLPAWHLLVVVACVSGTLLAGLIVRRARHVAPMLILFAVFTIVGTLGTAAGGQIQFDRYWPPLLPPMLVLVLSEPARVLVARRGSDASTWSRISIVSRRTLAGLALAGLAMLSFAIAGAGLAYDHARWSTATRLARKGIASTDINAGLEWQGYHSPRGMVPPHSHHFPGTLNCFIVSAQPPKPGAGTVISTTTYRTFLITGGRRDLYTYWTGTPGCPTPPQ